MSLFGQPERISEFGARAPKGGLSPQNALCKKSGSRAPRAVRRGLIYVGVILFGVAACVPGGSGSGPTNQSGEETRLGPAGRLLGDACEAGDLCEIGTCDDGLCRDLPGTSATDSQRAALDALLPKKAHAPSPQPQLSRLTHAQWENSIRALLRLSGPTGFLHQLAPDGGTSRFLSDATEMTVSNQLYLDYERAAATLAVQVAQDPTALGQLLPENFPSDPEGQPEAFVRSFLRRAYRRSLPVLRRLCPNPQTQKEGRPKKSRAHRHHRLRCRGTRTLPSPVGRATQTSV